VPLLSSLLERVTARMRAMGNLYRQVTWNMSNQNYGKGRGNPPLVLNIIGHFLRDLPI
jgi:hypothetical protein